MSTKKVTFLTVNSITALSKVHSLSASLVSGKGLTLVRNINIATERLDLQNPSSNGENRIDYQQNANGSYGHIPNYGDLQYKFDDGYSQQLQYRGNKGESSQNPNAFYKGDTLEKGFQHKPDVPTSENYIDRKVANMGVEHNRNRFEGNQNGQNGNSFGGYRHGEFQQNYMGQEINSDEKNIWQNPNNCSISNHNANNNENYWQNQGSTGNYNRNVGVMKQSPDNYGNNSALTYQQGMGGPYVGIRNEYNLHKIGGGGQNHSWNQNANTEHYLNNLNQSQSGNEGPSLPNDSEIVVECYKGTIEELDVVCKERKMEEVAKVMELLSKNQIPIDLSRYLMLMNACGEAEAKKEATVIHNHLMTFLGPDLEVSTYNKILEMYGKCGSIDDAVTVFNQMPKRNLTSWDTMITWFVKHDKGELALDIFDDFKQSGLKPDGLMFIAVFNACGLVGDVIEGMFHFQSMSKDYGIIPTLEHYVSIVNMMGTAGYLDEALEFIEKMPIEPNVEIWETLMNLCRVYGHELGDRCAELIDLMDPARLQDQSKAGLIPVKASDIEKEKEKKKLAAGNLLAVRSRVHEYRAADKSHPETERIYTLLRGMKEQMKEAGYVAETRFVLHDIDQESKEEALLAHSERLAVAYGLMSSPARAQMRIIKNLRVCGDCHSALKIISKLVGRELVIRDAKRFHHFKDGLCSCKDYW